VYGYGLDMEINDHW